MREALTEHLDHEDSLEKFIRGVLQGGTPPDLQPVTAEALSSLRARVSRALGAPGLGEEPPQGLSAHLIEAWCAASGDPDGILAEWVRVGAPLGVLNPVTPTGVFPPVWETPAAEADDLSRLDKNPQGRSNYRSAEDEPQAIPPAPRTVVRREWARSQRSPEPGSRSPSQRPSSPR